MHSQHANTHPTTICPARQHRHTLLHFMDLYVFTFKTSERSAPYSCSIEFVTKREVFKHTIVCGRFRGHVKLIPFGEDILKYM